MGQCNLTIVAELHNAALNRGSGTRIGLYLVKRQDKIWEQLKHATAESYDSSHKAGRRSTAEQNLDPLREHGWFISDWLMSVFFVLRQLWTKFHLHSATVLTFLRGWLLKWINVLFPPSKAPSPGIWWRWLWTSLVEKRVTAVLCMEAAWPGTWSVLET